MYDPKQDANRDAYSKSEAAERLGVSYVTMHERLCKPGIIRTVKAGRRVLIPKSEIERFLKDGNG